jgi:nitroimidazol reductase NimA-like FMN-containing flavoprotein (pyridoxamine 5'-phosphate oxidase superfamily)
MEVDRNGLEVLGRAECLRLLALTTIGRIGFTSGALPAVLPMNFRVSGDRILVRTRRGTKLDAALQNAVVAFEADDFDQTNRSGWSVAVTGLVTVVSDPVDLNRAYQMPIARWAPMGNETVLAISTEFVSGRRIIPGAWSMRQ